MLFIGTHVNKHNLTFSLTFSLTFLAVGQRFELNLIAKKKSFQAGKIILAGNQFTQCPSFNETPGLSDSPLA